MLESLKAKIAGAWKSWTIQVNAWLTALVLAAPLLSEVMPQLQAYLPENTYKWAMLAVLLANIALRFKTTKDLAAK